MVTQDKNKLLDKISNYCFFVLVFGFTILSMLNVPLIIVNIVSTIASCILYITILMRYKLNYEKMHKGLLCLGIICIIGSIFGAFVDNQYISILCSSFVYIFYIYNQKLTTNQWNKFLIFFGSFVVLSSILSIYFDNKWITGLFVIIELIVYGRILNRFMTSLGMKRKRKLEAEGFTEEDAKKVPLIRKILFGKTGKLDLSIVEMITGKDLTRKTKKS